MNTTPTMSQPVSAPGGTQPAPVDSLALTNRLSREGRWHEVQPVRDAMMRECRKSGMSLNDARIATYREIERQWPPLDDQTDQQAGDNIAANSGDSSAGASHAHAREGRLQGLDAIPETWPQLPGNATLAAELSWVQAERLRVVEERPSGAVVVHLDRAGSPAPSWAALSWLETSIRSYAKFVDICAKGLASQELESDMVRRERRSIEDVRRLLAEMLPPK